VPKPSGKHLPPEATELKDGSVSFSFWNQAWVHGEYKPTRWIHNRSCAVCSKGCETSGSKSCCAKPLFRTMYSVKAAADRPLAVPPRQSNSADNLLTE
jgi:hypothetical protein